MALNFTTVRCPTCDGVGLAVDNFRLPVEFDLMTGLPVNPFEQRMDHAYRSDGRWYKPGVPCPQCEGRRVVNVIHTSPHSAAVR
jgi:endogenous inhibitor of DNA gyrase (YacG/DUF329 family)